jgi:iron complex transport system permease protein
MTNRAPLLWAGSLLIALGVASLFIGVGSVVRNTASAADVSVLMVSRLPRTLAAMLAGGGLAIAGLVMQTMARNRFVEPSTAGTMQGAALGMLLVTLIAPTAPIYLKAIIAAAGALAVTSVFMAAALRLPPTQPFLIPLFGLVYGGVVWAAVLFIAWETETFQFVETWMNGEFSGVLRGRYELLWTVALSVAAAWWYADRLTILSMGRDASVGLGIDYQSILRIGLGIIAMLSTAIVVVVGAIPFVGLVVPALASRIMGDNLRASIPFVALSGATLMLACDMIGRLIRFPYEIPAGTICGVVGAVAFLVMLLSRAGRG